MSLLREPRYRPEEPGAWVLALTRSPADVEGMFCVVTRDRLRKRPLLHVAGADADDA